MQVTKKNTGTLCKQGQGVVMPLTTLCIYKGGWVRPWGGYLRKKTQIRGKKQLAEQASGDSERVVPSKKTDTNQ